MPERSGNILILLVEGYLLFTLGLFTVRYYGVRPNAVLVIVYCLVSFLALFVGWALRTRRPHVRPYFSYSPAMRRLLYFTCLASMLVSFVNVFSVYSSWSQVVKYAVDPGTAYEYVKYVNRNELTVGALSTSSVLGVVLTSLTFAKYYVLTLAPLYWRHMSVRDRLLVVVTAVIYGVHALAIGAMVNVASVLIAAAPTALLLSRGRRPCSRRFRVVAMSTLASGVVAVLYMLGSRGFGVTGKSVPAVLLAGWEGMSYYVSHGYVGLSYAIELPFVFTWGHTTLRGIAEVVLPRLGVASMWEQSYLARTEATFGWDSLSAWSTIFPWLASDVSFWLVPAIFLGVGTAMRRAWGDAVSTRNPFALAFLGQLMIFCMMIPANNQLFHTFGNAVAVIVIWLLYRLSVRSRAGGGVALMRY